MSDLTDAQTFYTAWKAAYLATASGKSYEINTGGSVRKLTRNDVDTAKKEMLFWKSEVTRLQSGQTSNRFKFITPIQ